MTLQTKESLHYPVAMQKKCLQREDIKINFAVISYLQE